MTDMDWKEIDRETTRVEEITTLRKELAEARAALEKIKDGYGPNHMSRFAFNVADTALRSPSKAKGEKK